MKSRGFVVRKELVDILPGELIETLLTLLIKELLRLLRKRSLPKRTSKEKLIITNKKTTDSPQTSMP